MDVKTVSVSMTPNQICAPSGLSGYSDHLASYGSAAWIMVGGHSWSSGSVDDAHAHGLRGSHA